MLRREDNPQLFNAIATEYAKTDINFLMNLTFNKVSEMTDEQLNTIKTLNLTKSKQNIVSLKGIEQLKNLQKLHIDGMDSNEYTKLVRISKLNYSELKNEKELYQNIKQIQYLYNKNQIEDLTPIYNLPNLKVLSLKNQRNIKSINLEMLPKLETISLQSCSNLREVNGIDKLQCWNKSLLKIINFDFSGCVKLSKVNGFGSLLTKLSQKKVQNDLIFLPTTTFCFLTNKNKTILNKLCSDDLKNVVKWCEISGSNTRIRNNSVQMALAKNKIDNIIKTICDEDDSQIEQIYKIYKWVVNNVRYDYEGVAVEANMSNKERRMGRLDQNSITNVIRSSLVALWDRKSTCAGLSNLLNLILSDAGIVTGIVECSLKKANDDFMKNHNWDLTLGDIRHQISSLNINGSIYYLDPTVEKHNKKFKAFLKNKSEISKTHQLTMYDYTIKDGLSLQSILEENNLLMNQDSFVDAYSSLIKRDSYKDGMEL